MKVNNGYRHHASRFHMCAFRLKFGNDCRGFITLCFDFFCFLVLERFSYDLEMKTREQNRNNKRTEIERFDWFIEWIQTRVAFGGLSERSAEKTSCPRTL